MSRLHIMQSNSLNTYSVYVHTPTPAGNNSAGVSWATCRVNSLTNVSSLTVGPGPGQISNAERNAIIAGTVLETSFAWGDDPAWTNPERTADLNLRADQAVAEATTEFQKKMKFFGHEVA